MTMHFRDKFLHPIYLWIRDFHCQFQSVVRASHRIPTDLWPNESHPVLGYIYNLLGDILTEVPKNQIIEQKNNTLKLKKYKKALNHWFAGNDEQFPEVLCF